MAASGFFRIPPAAIPGVTMVENAIVGAHSFVKSDIPSSAVAYGVPARVRRVQD